MTGTGVAVQWEDRGLWAHGVIAEPSDDHRGDSYTIQVTKTSRLIMQNSKHICSSSIMSEEYLSNEVKKLSGGIGGHFCIMHTQGNALPHQHHTVNITRDTLTGQIEPSKIRQWNVVESIVAHDIADKCENGRKSQTQHARCKPCTASMPN